MRHSWIIFGKSESMYMKRTDLLEYFVCCTWSDYFRFSGTIEERGIATWQNVDDPNTARTVYAQGYDVYNPWLPQKIKNSKFLKYIPFMPNPEEGDIPHTLTDEIRRDYSMTCNSFYNFFSKIYKILKLTELPWHAGISHI